MSVAPQQGARDRLGREVWIVAAVVIVGVIMSILDTTIVNVALETLSRELNSPLSTIQWVSAGYLLALAIVIRSAGGSRSGSARGGSGWSPSPPSGSARRSAASPGPPAR